MASESGPWSICKFGLQEGTDCYDYSTIKWGFDSKKEALAAIKSLAREEGVSEADLVVILTVWPGDEPRDHE